MDGAYVWVSMVFMSEQQSIKKDDIGKLDRKHTDAVSYNR